MIISVLENVCLQVISLNYINIDAVVNAATVAIAR